MQLKLLSRNKIYDGKVFNVIVDNVEYPSGNQSIREVAEHSGGAVILPLFPDKSIILIKQHRYPLNEYIWELPAGKLKEGENPLECAKRELEEETGYSAKQWQKITSIYTTPGFCNEILHLYLATQLFPTGEGQKLEEGEQSLTLKIIPLAEAIAMIEQGEIRDGKSICSILIGQRILKKELLYESY